MPFLSLPYITIPNLDLEFIGLGQVSFFSIFVAIGILSMLWTFDRFCTRGGDVNPKVTRYLMIIMLAGAYPGAYWGQLFLYSPEWLEADSLAWLKIYNGGFSSIGGFYGYIITGFIVVKFFYKEPFLPYLDRAWLSNAIGWAIARIGCSIAHDHPGKLTDFFLGVKFPDGVRYDLGLYECVFSFVILIPALFWVSRKPWRTGTLVATAFLLYCPSRIMMDFLRVGDIRYSGLTAAQWGLIPFFLLGIYLLYKSQKEKWPLQPALWGRSHTE